MAKDRAPKPRMHFWWWGLDETYDMIQAGIRAGIASREASEAFARVFYADAVCLARAMLRDPYWPRRAASQLRVEMPWPDQYKRADAGPLGR